jgi:transposase-like protein
MDDPVAKRTTDVLGRRSGPRRRYSLAEKRAIVEETQARGASVPEVAQRHGINHNLIFGWRRLYQQGLLSAEAAAASAPLLPVKIATPTVVPESNTVTKAAPRRRRRAPEAAIEIEFGGKVRLVIRGVVDRATLDRVIAVLSGR